MYRLNKYFGIKPHEIHLIPIEDRKALLTMHDYDVDATNKRKAEAARRNQ